MATNEHAGIVGELFAVSSLVPNAANAKRCDRNLANSDWRIFKSRDGRERGASRCLSKPRQ